MSCMYAERVKAMLVWGPGGEVFLSAGCECMGVTRGSGLVSTWSRVWEDEVVLCMSVL